MKKMGGLKGLSMGGGLKNRLLNGIPKEEQEEPPEESKEISEVLRNPEKGQQKLNLSGNAIQGLGQRLEPASEKHPKRTIALFDENGGEKPPTLATRKGGTGFVQNKDIIAEKPYKPKTAMTDMSRLNHA